VPDRRRFGHVNVVCFGCESWAFWGTLFQLVVSTFNWINRVMEDVGEKAGRMFNKKASRNRTVERG
jgi:hypothetical protein